MTMKEMRRLQTIETARAGRITNSEGARRLGLSDRQFKRLRKRVATEGPQGAIHKGRGKVSNR
ncbi:MAG: helix-turn-helix domain-containing protein, partial [Coriobacteriia bacterium]|nr:helix-turn-helix domain-containing protein [Coriobacteriia bacterium]